MKLITKLNISILLAILILTPIVFSKTYQEPKNITGSQDLAQWNDQVLEGKFGVGIILIVFFVSFIILKGFESSQAFTGCLFFTFATALACWALEILAFQWLIGTAILCGLTIILILWSNP